MSNKKSIITGITTATLSTVIATGTTVAGEHATNSALLMSSSALQQVANKLEPMQSLKNDKSNELKGKKKVFINIGPKPFIRIGGPKPFVQTNGPDFVQSTEPAPKPPKTEPKKKLSLSGVTSVRKVFDDIKKG